jgi:hypothetical protein
MPWTKRQFVEAAFEEIGLAYYVFDLQPEQLNMALRRLDSMMATWNTKGIRLGYPLPSSATSSDLDEDSGVPDSANEAIILNLAVRLAPGFGKSVSADTKLSARNAYRGLVSISAMPQEMQFPKTLPRGAGNKTWSQGSANFVDVPDDPLAAGPDGPIEFD